MKLSGKSAVYVGGFGGIGMASCAAMLKRDLARLTIMDLTDSPEKRANLNKLSPSAKIHFQALNLLDGQEKISQTLRQVVDKWGRFHVLVNGSGIVNDRNAKLTVDINLLGLIETALAAIPLMSKAEGGNGGVILNVASTTGLQPTSFICVYSATKHGVIGFTRSCAEPLYYERNAIKHITLCPGATITGILDNFVGVDTFEYSKPLSEKYINAKNQTAEVCGEHMANVLESAENGDIWLSDLGELRQVEMPKLWSYQF